MAKPIRYSKMKDSGMKWIGDIPKHWGTCRAKKSFMQSNERGNVTPVLLSASQKYGMCPQTDLEGVVKVSEKVNLQDFKTVHKNDFVISLRSFQGGFERSDYEGVCSPAYQVFRMVNNFDNNYLKWLFKSTMFIDEMNSLTVGIREGKKIKYDDFANSVLPVPPLTEQKAIASYLDEDTDIHHIFPQAYCEGQKYPMRKWNSVVNKTPIYASTNRSIGGRAPSEYIKTMRNKGLAEELVVSAITSHKINFDLLSTDSFDEYFVDRAIRLLDRIEKATGKAISGRDSEETIKEFGCELNKRRDS